MEKQIEILGYVYKEERIKTLDEQHILPGSFAAEISHPFPGFYSWREGPEAQANAAKPRSLLLFTDKTYTLEHILRTGTKSADSLGYPISARPATVWIGNRQYQAIRLKNLNSFQDVKNVQQVFLDNQFAFLKKPRGLSEESVRIKLQKFFLLHQEEKGIFRDLKKIEMSYLQIQKHIGWEQFRAITENIKNNISDRIFDVAQASWYRNGSVEDYLRVYKPNADISVLREIRHAFLKKL